MSFFRGVLALSVIAGCLVGAALHSFNHFKTVENLVDPSCLPVTGIAGPEDLQIDAALQRVFISSFDRRAKPVAGAPVRGAIHVVAIDDPLAASAWRDRTGGAPARFEPLGLSLYDDGEVKRLFVVNAAVNAVELFDVAENGDLVHLETLSESRLTSVNDVAAVGPRSFYVTNDVAPGRASLFGKLQFVTKAATGALYYYDGLAWRTAAQDLRFANGVVVNAAGTRLYLAETTGMTLRIYDRDPAVGVLTLADTVALPGAADNLNIADDGALLIGANPKPLTLPMHRQSAERRSPSLVLRYQDDVASDDPGDRLATLYQSDGEHLSAATVADASNGKMVVGALVDDRFLICSLKP